MKPLPLRKGDGSPNLTAIVRVLTAELEKLAPDDQLPERSLHGLRVALGLEKQEPQK